MPGQAEARGNAPSQDPGAPGPSWGNSWDCSVFPPVARVSRAAVGGVFEAVLGFLALPWVPAAPHVATHSHLSRPELQGWRRPGSTPQLDAGVPPPGKAGLLAFWELVHRLARAPENYVGGKGKFGRCWQRVRDREAGSTPPEMGRPWAWTQQGRQAPSQAVPSVGLSLLWTQGGALARS